MATAQLASPPTHRFMQRVAVTLGVLALYRLGTYVPLAGINQAALADLYQGGGLSLALERLSIFALGIYPVLTALLFVEAVRLASGRFDAWVDATPANARLVDRYTLVGALLLAALQGYGLAGALEDTKPLVTNPGAEFRLGAIATFAASTALLAWLATIISRHGLGSGVWILLLAPYLASLPGLAGSVFNAVQTGTIFGGSVVATFLVVLAMLAGVIALAQALTTARMPLERTLIWPLFIAPIVVSSLSAIAWLQPVSVGGVTGTLVYAAAILAIVMAVSLAQWTRVAGRSTADGAVSPSAEPGGRGLMVVTALVLAGITVVPDLLAGRLDVPLVIDGRNLIILAVVGLAMQGLLLRPADKEWR